MLRALLLLGVLAQSSAFSQVGVDAGPRITDFDSFRAAVMAGISWANEAYPSRVPDEIMKEVLQRMWAFVEGDTNRSPGASADPDVEPLVRLLEYLGLKASDFFGSEAWAKIESYCGLDKPGCGGWELESSHPLCVLRMGCAISAAQIFAVIRYFPCGLACPAGPASEDGSQRFLIRADNIEKCQLLARWYGCGASCEYISDDEYVQGMLAGMGGKFDQKFFATCPATSACLSCPDIDDLHGYDAEYRPSDVEFGQRDSCPWMSQCVAGSEATCSVTIYRDDNGGGCEGGESEEMTVGVGQDGNNDNLRTLLDNDVTSIEMKVTDSTQLCEATFFKGNRRNDKDGDCYWKLQNVVNEFQVGQWHSKKFSGKDNGDTASAYHLQYSMGKYDAGVDECTYVAYEAPDCNDDRDEWTGRCPTDDFCAYEDHYDCTADAWCTSGGQYPNFWFVWFG